MRPPRTPSRGTKPFAGHVTLLLLLVAAGGSACSSPPPEPPNPVDGNIVAIAEGELTLEAEDGDRYIFTIADPTVPIRHLHEHRTQELPVRITWRREGERFLATRIADAPLDGTGRSARADPSEAG